MKGDDALNIKYQRLLEAAGDLATALLELNLDPSFATTVIHNFEQLAVLAVEARDEVEVIRLVLVNPFLKVRDWACFLLVPPDSPA